MISASAVTVEKRSRAISSLGGEIVQIASSVAESAGLDMNHWRDGWSLYLSLHPIDGLMSSGVSFANESGP